jgi:hypothetical protein
MKGARIAEFRPYWIRYLRALWAGEKLRWVRDNILITCVCSLLPGLITAGVSAVFNDYQWRAVARATLVTYSALLALCLIWRLVYAPIELDRQSQRFIHGLLARLADTKSTLATLETHPPRLEIEILDIHVQPDTSLPSHTVHLPVGCDIFVRVKLTLRETQAIERLEYQLSSVLHGNSANADYVNDLGDWGLVIAKKPVGIGTTFHYTVSKLTQLAEGVDRTGVPVEGWLHFHANGVHKDEIAAAIYRLNVLTPRGAVSADILGHKIGRAEFLKLCNSHPELSSSPG